MAEKLRITAINEKQEDGSYINYPLGVKSDNVALESENKTLTTKVSEIDAGINNAQNTADQAVQDAADALTEAKEYTDQVVSASDAMVFRGTLGAGGTYESVPTTNVVVGDTYKIITALTWAGYECRVGDLLIALKSGNITATTENWAHVPSGDEDMTTLRYSTSSTNLTTSAQTGDLIIGEAAIKQVDTSISAGSSSTNLPTTKAVVDYLGDKGLDASANIGSSTNPIYVENGSFLASTSTVGSGSKPIYLNNGVLTASSTSVGSDVKPVYLNAGAITVSSGTVGSGTKPIYLNSGTLTVSSSTVGSSTVPVYLNSGTVTACGSTLDVSITGSAASADSIGTATVGSNINPIYINAGTPTASTSTVGSAIIPIYLNAGSLTASTSTVGSGTVPMYLSSGTLTASTSTVGSGTKPIYLNSGTLTASSSTVGASAQPVYLNSGTITASSSTIGSTTQPVYMSSGVLTAMSGALSTTYGGTGNTSGRATYVEMTLTNPTSATRYYIPWTTGTSSGTNYSLNGNNGLRYQTLEGTTSALGYGRLDLGNNVTSDSDGDKYGGILIYGTESSYWYLSGNKSISSNYTIYMPTSSGCLVVGSNGSAIGSSSTPVYINSNGVATACGSLSASTLGTATVGSGVRPIYLNSGTPTASSSTVAAGNQLMYMSNGSLTVSSSTVGSSSTPVYLNNGTLTTCSNLTASQIGTSTVGSNTRPIYINNGTPTASSSTVGDETTPVYLKSGVITACSTGSTETYHIVGDVYPIRVGLLINTGTHDVQYTGIARNNFLSISDIESRYGLIYMYNSGVTYNYVGNTGTSLSIQGSTIDSNVSISTNSDEILKHNIMPLSTQNDTLIDLLIPRSYELNDSLDNKQHIGFIYQEVFNALEQSGINPENSGLINIHYDPIQEQDIGAIRYEEFIPILVREIQQLKAEIKELKASA